jgi:leader peptidase (prepilin peptidase)/N-methyltransferase
LSLLLAVMLGGLYAAGLLATRRATRKDTIAFGPFIAIGSVIVALLLYTPPR